MRFFSTILLLALTLFAAPAAAVPVIDSPVNDYANVLSADDVQRISDRIVAVRAATGVQMALLVVDTTSGEPIDDFSLAAARQWRGGRADRDDGVLVTFAVRDHKSDVEVGPGVQDRIPDVIARRILDEARPALRASRYGDAFYGVIIALGGRVSGAGAPFVPIANATAPAPKSDNGLIMFVLVAVLGFGVIGGVWLYRSGEEKRRREAAAEDERRAYARNMEREDRIREENRAREMREREAAAAVERYRVATPPPAPVATTESATKPSTYTPPAPKPPARSTYAPPPARSERSSYAAPARRSSPRIDTPVPAYRVPSPAFGVSIVTETPRFSACRSPSPALGSTSWSSDTSSSSPSSDTSSWSSGTSSSSSSSDTSSWSSDTSSSSPSSDNSGGGGSFDGGGASSGW